MNIRINTHGNPLPEGHGDWIDLRTAEDVELKCGEYKSISLGVSMELPAGYYAEVAPRSSTFENYGILMVNSIGIIDHDYCGDDDVWHFLALATRDVKIPKGSRISQFRLVKQLNLADLTFESVESLGNKNRGGIGSTGKN